MNHQFMGNLSNSCCHNIGSAYCTNDTAPLKRTLTVFDAGRSEFRNNREILPDFPFQSILFKFFTKNCVGFTYCFQTITSNSAWTTNTKSRSREWLTINHTVRQTKLVTNNTNLIFKKDPNRLYKFKVHIFRKPAGIMMCLNTFFRLKNIRPDRTLCQEFNSFKLSCFLSKNFNEFSTNNLSLCLRIFYACQFIKEPICSVHINKICIHLIAEHFNHLLRLTLTKQTMINMDTYQLLANRFDQKCCNNR